MLEDNGDESLGGGISIESLMEAGCDSFNLVKLQAEIKKRQPDVPAFNDDLVDFLMDTVISLKDPHYPQIASNLGLDSALHCKSLRGGFSIESLMKARGSIRWTL